ncbi:hypothetical protein ACKI1I_06935 [Streptomyces turgidiscabies]|uniref:Uncharacterized protein n=1 Tax=Streptomyces turgidiscabies (strain Car8) TaxID=698760 RepID=L7EYY3_STRT8|nr:MULTISPECIES: hypothetical protein [Streptomyces]ELP64618.1 hypothetical protein STRTUCAR8_09227 [Streptomyces turgidiscabies Car8]MDX3491553.1 hypothetical protein [Streptomyces turgidiscabies]GAQ73159.1 hypothetical protein T45_04915 [Streptomyces turgidiscabies]
MPLTIAEQRQLVSIGNASTYVLGLDGIWTTRLAADVPEPGSDAASELIDVGTEMATLLTHIHEHVKLLDRFADEMDELISTVGYVKEHLPVEAEEFRQHLREALQYVDGYAPEEAKDILAKIDLIRSGEVVAGDLKVKMRGALLIIAGAVALGAGIVIVALGVEDFGGPIQHTCRQVGGTMFKQGLQDWRAASDAQG